MTNPMNDRGQQPNRSKPKDGQIPFYEEPL